MVDRYENGELSKERFDLIVESAAAIDFYFEYYKGLNQESFLSDVDLPKIKLP